MTQPPRKSWWLRYRTSLRATFYAVLIALPISIGGSSFVYFEAGLSKADSWAFGGLSFALLLAYVYTAIKDAPDMERQW